jgi:hypothetical protein
MSLLVELHRKFLTCPSLHVFGFRKPNVTQVIEYEVGR